jgi:hypothetical protein
VSLSFVAAERECGGRAYVGLRGVEGIGESFGTEREVVDWLEIVTLVAFMPLLRMSRLFHITLVRVTNSFCRIFNFDIYGENFTKSS